MSRSRSVRSLATRALVAGGLLVLVTGSGTASTVGCSADLRDFYACDALAHAICGKWKDCGAITDEDACYKIKLQDFGGDGSSRTKCFDKLDDGRKCVTDIQALSCDNKTSPVESCNATINAAVADPDVTNPSTDGGSSGRTTSGGPTTGPDASTGAKTIETALAQETTSSQIVAVAADNFNVYWITSDGVLNQHALTPGGVTTALTSNASPPLEAAAGSLYFNASGELVRYSKMSGVTRLGAAAVQIAATSTDGFVLASTSSGISQVARTQQLIQNGQQVVAGPSITDQGTAYWSLQSKVGTTVYSWQQATSTQQRFGISSSSPQPKQFIGSFYIDESQSLFDVEAARAPSTPGGSSMGSAITTIPSNVTVYGSDTAGGALVGVRNDTDLVTISTTSGSLSALGSASRTIAFVYAREGRPLVWATSGSSPGVYLYSP